MEKELPVKIKVVREGGALPAYATPGSAGFDICAALSQPLTIAPFGRVTVPSGIAMQITQDGVAGFCFARSGLGVKHGITLSNGVGVIDNDYTGEILVGLVNLSDREYTLMPGERIAQIVLIRHERAQFIQAQSLDETQRGEGGFGSTGR